MLTIVTSGEHRVEFRSSYVGWGIDSSEYRYQHGALYQNVQRQFMMCVMSMDPNRILSLLEYNRKLSPLSISMSTQ